MLKKIAEIDRKFMVFMEHTYRSPRLDSLFSMLTHLGDLGAVWLLWAVALAMTKGMEGVLLFGSIAVCALICNLLMKPLFARKRPFERHDVDVLIDKPRDRSFPSGHTMASFTALAVIWQLCGGWMGWLALLVAMIIAWSRLYLLVHYFSDVLCGALFGLMVGKLCVVLGQFPAQWGAELLYQFLGK